MINNIDEPSIPNDTGLFMTKKEQWIKYRDEAIEIFATEVTKLRLPLVVVALFLFCSKLIPVWLILLFAYFAWLAIYPRLPLRYKENIDNRFKHWSAGHLFESNLLKDLKEGVRFMKPFLFTALFFAAAPISVLVMIVYYVKRLFKKDTDEPTVATEPGAVVFKQNLLKQKDEETSFFHSRAFALTTFGFVGLGLPVAVIVFLYSSLGIEQLMEKIQERNGGFIAYSATLASNVDQNHAVAGRRLSLAGKPTPLPDQHSAIRTKPIESRADFLHFALYAYMMSLAWCAAVLFFRAYFTFPLNFYSTEYDLEIDQYGVRKHPIKGWFAEFVWYFWPDYMPRFYSWQEIKRVDYAVGGFGRLAPLPPSLFAKDSLVYKGLNKLAMATDAMVDKIGRTEFVAFDCNEDYNNSASRIPVRLWELSSDDKARLFYAIRTHNPYLVIDEKLQEKLIGSPVMKEARYTEIWFDLLTSNQDRIRQDSLQSGDTLCGGKYSVKEKLGAGGQAAAFLAANDDGEEVVLKEFILTSAETFGALMESATDFENESSTLSRLDHPNVVKFLNIFAEDRRAYIVLEHVKGTTLRKFVEEHGPLSENDVVELAIQMCDILQYLHQQSPPVVHRDFTPENLIRQPDGSLKIVDFSVASRTGPHKPGDCVGKHSYTPPEQFRSQASSQSDLYAFGATLYFLLTGADPRPITMSDPRSVNPSISEKLADIVMKSTALETWDRYESATWIKLDLEELRPQPTAEPPVVEEAPVVIKINQPKKIRVAKKKKAVKQSSKKTKAPKRLRKSTA